MVRGWPAVGADDAGTAVALARRAIVAGAEDAMALVAAGFTLVMVARDYDAGLDAVRRAVGLNPGSGFVAMLSTAALVFGGDPQAALTHVERAMALSPLDPVYHLYLTTAGIAHLFLGHLDQALELGKRSASLNPDWDVTYWLLVSAYVRLDLLAEARAALAKLLVVAPGLTILNPT